MLCFSYMLEPRYVHPCIDTVSVDTYTVLYHYGCKPQVQWELRMNLTLAVDERVVQEARKVAGAMGKSLNQLIREYLEALTAVHDAQHEIEEIQQLTEAGQGRSRGWQFDREEVHERA